MPYQEQRDKWFDMSQLLREELVTPKPCFIETRIEACLLKESEETEAGLVRHTRKNSMQKGPKLKQGKVAICGKTGLEE